MVLSARLEIDKKKHKKYRVFNHDKKIFVIYVVMGTILWYVEWLPMLILCFVCIVLLNIECNLDHSVDGFIFLDLCLKYASNTFFNHDCLFSNFHLKNVSYVNRCALSFFKFFLAKDFEIMYSFQ